MECASCKNFCARCVLRERIKRWFEKIFEILRFWIRFDEILRERNFYIYFSDSKGWEFFIVLNKIGLNLNQSGFKFFKYTLFNISPPAPSPEKYFLIFLNKFQFLVRLLDVQKSSQTNPHKHVLQRQHFKSHLSTYNKGTDKG